MLRRVILALCALLVATAGQAQNRPWAAPGFRPGFQFAGRAGALPTLGTIATTRAAVYGTTRLVAGYAGGAARLVRPSDSATQDAVFTATGVLDFEAAAAWAGTRFIPVDTWRDQGGNGRDATATSTAPGTLPILTTLRDAYGATFPATPIVVHRGVVYATQAQAAVVAGLRIPASVTVDKANTAWMHAVAPSVSYKSNTLSGLGDLTGTNRLNLTTSEVTTVAGPGLGGGQIPSPNPGGGAYAPRTTPQVLGTISRSTGRRVIVEDVSYSAQAEATGVLLGGLIGSYSGANAAYYMRGDSLAFIAYQTAPSDADFAADQSVLAGVFNTARKANRVITLGSSSAEGIGPNNAGTGLATQNYGRLALGRLPQTFDLYNLGVGGRTLQNVSDGLASEAYPLIAASGVRNVVVLPDPGNSIAEAGGTATSAYATLKNIATALKGRPGTVLLVALTARARSDSTGSAETERQAVNTLIRNGQADLGYAALADLDAIPQLQSATSGNANLVTDTDGRIIHANNAGHALMAVVLANAIAAAAP